MLNWNDLRYLIAAQRAGSLAGAAKHLKVDQATVSRRLAALEEALGTRLFDRTSDGLVLTPAGERAIAELQGLEERIAAVETKVAGGDERIEGTVRIATSENLALGFLLKDLVAVCRTHSDLALEIVTGTGAVNLLRREADLAIRVGPRARSSAQDKLVARKLTEIGFVLAATKDYLDTHPALRMDDGFAGHDIVGYDEALASIPPAEWLSATATNARAVVRVNSILGAATCAAEGIGLAVVPTFAMTPTLVRALPGVLVSTECWLLVHPDLVHVARVRAVVDHVVAFMTERAPFLRGEKR